MTRLFVMAVGVTTLTVLAVGGAEVRAQPSAVSSQLSPKQKAAERKAMGAFTAGEYKTAATIYSDLYAEFHEPIYLRNVGRCYQQLKNPERAIRSYTEYLERSKRVTPEERAEIEAAISEMRALQIQQAGVAAEPAAGATAGLAAQPSDQPNPTKLQFRPCSAPRPGRLRLPRASKTGSDFSRWGSSLRP